MVKQHKIRHSLLLAIFLLLPLMGFCQIKESIIKSPDKRIEVRFGINSGKDAYYNVRIENTLVIDNSKLGLKRQDEDFTKGFVLESASKDEFVKDNYQLIGKRSNCSYSANKKVVHLKNESGKKMDIIFQVSNDGVAFRYYFPESSTDIKKIDKEITSFKFIPSTKAFLQPMSDAKTGWSRVHPSYEEFYKKGIDAGTPSPTSAGWVYPALFNPGKYWVLITEAAMDRNYCATRLAQNSPDNEYSVDFPQALEFFPGGNVNPESKLPWHSPWRVLTIGSLKTIVESTLGTDLANPAIKIDQSFIKPGQSSWSWVLLKDDSTVYPVQKKFIDYAADMHWEYCLIDADWDKKIGYEKAKELADYAKTKNIGIILWYNSAGDWNDTPYTPKDKMLTSESRQKEFAKLSEMGIKGVKIDFFGGDGQSFMKYYLDILDDAAKYKILVNFHGSTLPRGWQRTYPHLMSMEAIKGFEFVTFDQGNANEEPGHATVIPFTRNAFDPMDFTPVCLYKIPGIQRKTTSAFELALSVIFLSGVQHMAEVPSGMAKVPPYVKTFLQEIPNQWQETKFIDGYPGKFVVIARKGEKGWYVAGINGEATGKKLAVDLSTIPGLGKKGTMITDGNSEAPSFEQKEINLPQNGKIEVDVKPNGGFVITF